MYKDATRRGLPTSESRSPAENAERAIELALAPSGIPPVGAQPPCCETIRSSSAPNYSNSSAPAAIPTPNDPLAADLRQRRGGASAYGAANLKGFASQPMDRRSPRSRQRIGHCRNTSERYDSHVEGDMVTFVNDTFADLDERGSQPAGESSPPPSRPKPACPLKAQLDVADAAVY